MAAVTGSPAEANSPSFSAAAASGGGGGVVAVGPEYCSPYPLELAVKRKIFSRSENCFIADVSSNNILFRVQAFGLRKVKMRIIDAAGVPILTIKPKAWSWSDIWQVFRGEGSELIFSVKSSDGFFRRKQKVYLANNTAENHCDFQIKKGFHEESYIVYAGESEAAIVAEIHECTPKFFSKEKDMFTVEIQPNVDHAFIVALTSILDAMESGGRGGNGGIDGGIGGGTGVDIGGGGAG